MKPLKTRKALGITPDDQIVCAYADRASGPGWANSPLWVIVRRGGILRQECLQPEEQTREIAWLYSVSASAHEAMTGAVRAAVEEV